MAIESATGSPGDVLEFSVLTTKPDSEKALLLLKKIHSLVKPIMKKHGWILPHLAEFFPKNPNLLGVNVGGGLKICIRLRPHEDPHSFYSLEEILIGTMLHELTHNLFGPHDGKFFAQLDKLSDEFYALRAKGYEGEGFLGKGTRVGFGSGHDKGISKDKAKKIALKKYEERDRLTRLLGKGGKLGGAVPDLKGRRPADFAADAAERRIKETNSCGGGGHSHDGANGVKEENLSPEMKAELAKASRESKSYVIDLTVDSDNEEVIFTSAARNGENGNDSDGSGMETRSEDSSDLELIGDGDIKGKGKANSNSRRQPSPDPDSSSDIEIIEPTSKRPSSSSLKKPPPSKRTLSASTSTSTASSSSSTSATISNSWNCIACTYENTSSSASFCVMCATPRPQSYTHKPIRPAFNFARPDGWMCEVCLTVTDHNFWTCCKCGKVKTSSAPYL